MNDDKNKTGKPLDPSSNMADMMGDPSGMTGISQGNTNSSKKSTNQAMSSTAAQSTDDTASEDEKVTDADINQISDMLATGAGSLSTNSSTSPDEEGEQSVSGDMPDPESDDDTLQNAQVMGMQLEEDDEHPQEIDIARDIDKVEEYHRSN